MGPNSNSDVKILALKEAPTAILVCKYYAFKGGPNSSSDGKILALKEAPNSNFNV